MTTAAKTNRNYTSNSKLPSTEVSKKIARNLNQDFDEVTIHEDYSFEGKSDTPARRLDRAEDDKRGRLKENRQPGNKKISSEGVAGIPKSYLLAMEHLQDALEDREQQIEEAKKTLLEKEEYIYECETRINETLKKYQQLVQKYQRKQMEVEVLKAQNQQLRYDRELAIKQTAKALEGEFKSHASLEYAGGRMDRAKTINERRHAPSHSAYSPQVGSSLQDTQALNSYDFRQVDFDLRSEAHPQKYEAMPSVAPLMSYRPTQKNFISYQREILRNEKELIAQKYRVECLERKLLSKEGNKEETKQKIRKLSTEITNKERMLQDLKKLT